MPSGCQNFLCAIRYIWKMEFAMNEMADESTLAEAPASGWRGTRAYWIVILAISSLVMLYAVTRAFVWDEGYHLIAAQQISQGKLPYIDFCFPQTPLNAYANAAVIKVFGQHWQPVHVLAALFSMGAMLLTAQFIISRFPVARWRLPLAIAAAVFVGLNEVVVQFGTIGQAYGICLFFTVAAYRVAVLTPQRSTFLLPLACGALAGVAAGSSLLTAPIVLMLFVWICFYNQAGPPLRKALAFLVGGMTAFLPVFWLFFQGREQTIFNVLKYHALYRRSDWPGAGYHDLQVFTSWLDSTQALTLVLLSLVAFVFLRKQATLPSQGADWSRLQRAEFYLAAWISLAEGAYLCTPHPTFGRYFIFLTPFLTLLSMVGVYALASKMGYGARPTWPAGVAAVLMAMMCSSFVVNSFQETTWQEYEKVAQKVASVTPQGGRIFADEVVYFALGQNPPSGMEVSDTHTVTLSARDEKLEHIVSLQELKDQFANHDFATVQSCSDAEMDRYGLPASYRYHADINDCTVYWGQVPPQAPK